MLYKYEILFVISDRDHDNEPNNNKDKPRLGSRRNTFSQPIITDKGDGTHDVSYVPPPVGDPYEVEYPQYLTIPTSWPRSLTDQQSEPTVPLAVMLNAASKWVHSFLHKSYFSSNPLEQKFSTCIYAFFASELLSLILAANITQFDD